MLRKTLADDTNPDTYRNFIIRCWFCRRLLCNNDNNSTLPCSHCKQNYVWFQNNSPELLRLIKNIVCAKHKPQSSNNNYTISTRSFNINTVILFYKCIYYRHSFSEITCPAIRINVTTNVKVFTDGVVIGSRATYSCVIGYNITAGVATCECLDTAKWSCGPPSCTRE